MCGVRCIYLYVVQSAVGSSAYLCNSKSVCNYNNPGVLSACHVSPASKPPPGLPFRLPVFPAWTRSAPLDDNVHDGLVCEAVVAEDLAIAQVDQPCAVKVLRALLAACRNEAAALSD